MVGGQRRKRISESPGRQETASQSRRCRSEPERRNCAKVGLLRTRRNSARHIAFEGVAAGDHGEAILELDEAAIHRAAGEDEASAGLCDRGGPSGSCTWSSIGAHYADEYDA